MKNAVEKKKAQKTNFDKITRSPETLAKIMSRHGNCEYCIYGDMENCKGLICEDGTLAWLKLPAENGGE